MGIEVTSMKYTIEDPKKVDFESLPDDKFFERKILQAFSLLPKIYHITRLIKIENDKIDQIVANAPMPKVESIGMSATIHGPIIIDTTTMSSLEFSLLLIQFTYVEALCNVISECTIRQNLNTHNLNDIEIDYLYERKGIFKKGKISYSQAFVRLEDKIQDYFDLFCKCNNDEFKFDRSVHYWENFKNAKKIRDDITHPRNGVSSDVDRDVLFKMSTFIYWYTNLVSKRFSCLNSSMHFKQIEPFLYASLNLINTMNGGKHDNINEFTTIHNQILK